MSWFYVDAERRQVEIADGQLEALVDAGTIGPDTLVWKEGMDDWTPAARAFPDRFSGALAPAVPAPVPAAYAQGVPPPTSSMAVASLVCGVLTFAGCSIIAAIPGVICGHIALGQIRSAPSLYGGRGLALAGLILGYVGIAMLVIVLLFYAVFILGMFGLAAGSAASGGGP